MVFIPDSDITRLLDAVPSFREPWRKAQASQAKYAAEFPDGAQTPEERVNAFLGRLAYHVGERVAAGRLDEVESLGVALESVYSGIPEQVAHELTIGFLESLVYGTEYAGGDASKIAPFMTGSHTRWRWRQAYGYAQGVYLYDRASDTESDTPQSAINVRRPNER